MRRSKGITNPDDASQRPTAAQIRKDLATIAPYTNSIRTYSSTGGLEQIPRSPPSSACASPSVSGSTKTSRATSAKSALPSTLPAATAT